MTTNKERIVKIISEVHSGNYEEACKIADSILESFEVCQPCEGYGAVYLKENGFIASMCEICQGTGIYVKES